MKIFYKKLVLSLLFCISLSVMSAQTMEIVHLKNGFDAKGTVVERNDSIVTLKTETGKTVTINAKDIESVEQEKPAFDPKVFIGKWACYKASGERISDYDIEIKENQGFYTVNCEATKGYESNSDFIGGPEGVPAFVSKKDFDIEIDDKGNVIYYYRRVCAGISKAKSKTRSYQSFQICDDIVVSFKYNESKLVGFIDCTNHYYAWGHYNYFFVQDALDAGRGRIMADGPGEKWKVYFVKQ